MTRMRRAWLLIVPKIVVAKGMRMTDCFIGLDVSKGYADIAVLDERSCPVMKEFQLDDTAKGHATLLQIISSLAQKQPGSSFYVAAESTGGLENNWLHQVRSWQKDLPIHVARLNPNGVAQHMKADLTRTITDAVSARAIASYQIAHRQKIRYDEPVRAVDAMRPTWTAYVLLKKQLRQIANNLHPLLYSANPGMVRFCKRGIPGWMLRVLEKYPTAQHLSKAKPETLAKIPFITRDKAEKLIAIAAEESGSRCGEAIEQTMALLIAQMRYVTDACTKLEKIMTANIGDDPMVGLINSIRGIGPVSAIGLAINMPDVSCLSDAGQLAAYWGLHPVFKNSGDGKSVPRMSKAGRVQPRMILFMTAMSAIVCDPHLRALYHRKLKGGMAKKAALGYIMHKMARIIYGVVKNGTKYDAKIDEANSTKTPKVSTTIAKVRHQKELRRLQQMDPEAPISRRETKRRAALAETQDINNIKCEFISQSAACINI